MTTSDPDAWIAARVEALEAANGVTVEKIAAMDAALSQLYRRCQELEEMVHRLAAASPLGPDAALPGSDPSDSTLEQNAARASRAQEGRTGQERRDRR